MTETDADVVVLGAGLSGLWSAHTLARHDVSVLLVEARDRVGGRANTVTVDGTPVDVGGQFVCDGHPAILRALETCGMRPVAVAQDGEKLFDLAGEVSRYDVMPALEEGAFELAIAALAALDVETAELDPREPWAAPNAADLDRRNVGEWIAANLTGQAQLLPRLLVETITCTPPEECSLLAFATHLRACGGWFDILFTAQSQRIDDGAGELARRLGDLLGDRLLLRSPVARLHHQADHVVVELEDGRSLTGRRIISALPLPLSGFVRPGGARAQLARSARMGSVIKAGFVFAEPWWRAAGLNGSWISDGPLAYGFDTSPPDGSRGVLVGFTIAAAARELGREQRAIPDVLLGELQRIFGDGFQPPDAVVHLDWSSERFTGGGYAASFPPGALTEAGAGLRQPEGLVHWAGAETGVRWPNFMDSAIEAGERAATEALAALDRSPQRANPT